jgi:hypothetical protein
LTCCHCLQELSNDKAGAELELRGKLATLRYLLGIKAREAARLAAEDAEAAGEVEEAAGPAAGAAAEAAAAGRAGGPAAPAGRALPGGAELADREDICPICHDPLGQELVREGGHRALAG